MLESNSTPRICTASQGFYMALVWKCIGGGRPVELPVHSFGVVIGDAGLDT